MLSIGQSDASSAPSPKKIEINDAAYVLAEDFPADKVDVLVEFMRYVDVIGAPPGEVSGYRIAWETGVAMGDYKQRYRLSLALKILKNRFLQDTPLSYEKLLLTAAGILTFLALDVPQSPVVWKEGVFYPAFPEGVLDGAETDFEYFLARLPRSFFNPRYMPLYDFSSLLLDSPNWDPFEPYAKEPNLPDSYRFDLRDAPWHMELLEVYKKTLDLCKEREYEKALGLVDELPIPWSPLSEISLVFEVRNAWLKFYLDRLEIAGQQELCEKAMKQETERSVAMSLNLIGELALQQSFLKEGEDWEGALFMNEILLDLEGELAGVSGLGEMYAAIKESPKDAPVEISFIDTKAEKFGGKAVPPLSINVLDLDYAPANPPAFPEEALPVLKGLIRFWDALERQYQSTASSPEEYSLDDSFRGRLRKIQDEFLSELPMTYDFLLWAVVRSLSLEYCEIDPNIRITFRQEVLEPLSKDLEAWLPGISSSLERKIVEPLQYNFLDIYASAIFPGEYGSSYHYSRFRTGEPPGLDLKKQTPYRPFFMAGNYEIIVSILSRDYEEFRLEFKLDELQQSYKQMPLVEQDWKKRTWLKKYLFLLEKYGYEEWRNEVMELEWGRYQNRVAKHLHDLALLCVALRKEGAWIDSSKLFVLLLEASKKLHVNPTFLEMQNIVDAERQQKKKLYLHSFICGDIKENQWYGNAISPEFFEGFWKRYYVYRENS